ncbi:hypothetical protein OVY01_02350 [Robbsia sp. Bb-Pol-6]|uniref:Uncharacterized protein n=1 Tax=Robbsia betulipollinis TaxID=2981849 RepID=A0ABT3ZHV2_9BURK|nr:hypothetical protein [Robbsia betulipollinis]MCY0386104.1 hypothetical protein [Robbsia betulipollinis]
MTTVTDCGVSLSGVADFRTPGGEAAWNAASSVGVATTLTAGNAAETGGGVAAASLPGIATAAWANEAAGKIVTAAAVANRQDRENRTIDENDYYSHIIPYK